MTTNNIIFEIYRDQRTVFDLQDIAMIINQKETNQLRQKINYYVKTGRLINVRKGIYVKDNFNSEELACKIYKPSYISLEYVLQKAGVIFQYSEKITLVSYLTRSIDFEGNNSNIFLSLRKIRYPVLLNTTGILRDNTGINIACPERAFLDTIYLMKEYYFDNPGILDQKIIKSLLKIYNSNTLNNRVLKILKNV